MGTNQIIFDFPVTVYGLFLKAVAVFFIKATIVMVRLSQMNLLKNL